MEDVSVIKEAIVAEFGFLPPFFAPALENPVILENLWQQTRVAYLKNPLPAIYKEKLSLLLARYTRNPFCSVCHASSLVPLGVSAPDIFELINRPFKAVNISDYRHVLPAPITLETWPAPGTEGEKFLLMAAVAIFLKRDQEELHVKLKEILGASLYDLIILLVCYNQTTVSWTNAHPEISFKQDKRAIDFFPALLDEEPRFKEFVETYYERFQQQFSARAYLDDDRQSLRILFEQAPVAIALHEGPQHVFTMANAAFLPLVDYRDVLGKPIREALPELVGQGIYELLDEVYLSGKAIRADELLIKVQRGLAGLEEGYFSFVFQPVFDPEKNVVGIMVAANEVTDAVRKRKRNEIANLENLVNQKNFENLFLQTSMIINVLKGPTHIYEYLNPACLSLLGGDVTGKTVANAQPELVGSGIVEILDQVYKTGITANVTGRPVPIRNEIRYFDFLYAACRDKDGAIDGVMTLANDVTDVVRSQAALQTSEAKAELAREHLFNLFMQAPVGICVFEGPTHVCSLANPNFMNILFAHPRDFLGKPIRQALPEGKDQGYFELLDAVYKTGVSSTGTEAPVSITQQNGEPKDLFVNFVYQARRNSLGEVDGILVIISDVTEQALAKKKVEEAIRARDEFLSIASHELKTPLTSIQLQTQMIKRNRDKGIPDALSPARVMKLVEQTDLSVKRLTRLVDDMLDVSRISTGKLTFIPEEFDLSQLAREVVERMAPQALAAHAEVVIRGSEVVLGRWDRFRIEQVITNLLSNAIRYGQESTVEIEVRKENHRAILRVKDKGPGIAPENHERIFQRFERATDANAISGMGLGLFICREIIVRHHGAISVESEIDKGAMFTIELPTPPA